MVEVIGESLLATAVVVDETIPGQQVYGQSSHTRKLELFGPLPDDDKRLLDDVIQTVHTLGRHQRYHP